MNTTKIDKKALTVSLIAAAVLLLTLILCLFLIPKKKPDPPAATEATVPETTSPYLSEVFSYEGDYLTCLTRESIPGIDVSNHQGDIDWEQVRLSGIQFAFIRVGYRGTDLGNVYEDERAQQNYAGAKKAGIKIGGYFFSQAVSVEEAMEEASFALSVTKDWEMDLPLVYDWEYTGEDTRVARVSDRTVTNCTAAFCRAVEEAGRKSMVYCNPYQYRELLMPQELPGLPLWYAEYTDAPTLPRATVFWQYTETGSVPGIAGNVDIDLYFPPKPLA